MNNIKLLLINTIGLTGADLLLPKLSLYDEIAMLPGQNFSIFGDNLYRAHEYNGWECADIFDSLSRSLYTKEGKIWMGLTKNMKEEERNAYPKELHKKIFTQKINRSREFTSIIKAYILSYYEALGFDNSKRVFAAWFSHNVLLNQDHYKKFSEQVVVIHVSCTISLWLTYISQTRTWDCSKAIRFWLVNNLYTLMYSLEKGNTLIVNTDDLIYSEINLMKQIEDFLSITNNKTSHNPSVGFIKVNNQIIKEQSQISSQIDEIYRDNGLYKLAITFNEWSYSFIEQDYIKEMLGEFSNFWNSTSHTNFDWIGPVGESIIQEIVDFNKVTNLKNFSYTFYHEYFELNSDHYDQVNSNLHHYLGCLEDKIIVPPLPFFIRICIEYLTSAAKNSIKLGHSYISFKKGRIYLTLNTPEFQNKITRFGLRTQFEELERFLSEAEKACKQ